MSSARRSRTSILIKTRPAALFDELANQLVGQLDMLIDDATRAALAAAQKQVDAALAGSAAAGSARSRIIPRMRILAARDHRSPQLRWRLGRARLDRPRHVRAVRRAADVRRAHAAGHRADPTDILTAPKGMAITWDSDTNRTDIEKFFGEYGASSAWAAQTTEYGVGTLTAANPAHISGDAPVTTSTESLLQILSDNTTGANPRGAPPMRARSTCSSFRPGRWSTTAPTIRAACSTSAFTPTR